MAYLDKINVNGTVYDIKDSISSGIESYTYEAIQKIAQSGLASQYFNIGDQIITEYTDTSGTKYEMPWNITHFKNVTLQDGTTSPAIIIQSHYASVESIQYDAPEPDNLRGTGGVADANVAQYGYNRWSESGVRAWLNSDAVKKTGETGGWFGTTFERGGSTIDRQSYDVAPSQETTINGFKHGLPSAFLSIIKPIQISTKCNTVTDSGVFDTTCDMFWLPSCTECYNVGNNVVEGELFPYWKKRLVLDSPLANSTAYAPNITYALNNHTTACYVWRRSCIVSNSYNAWYSRTDGYVGNYYSCYYSFRVAPACAIC